jgi:predicted metal-dependent phosphotriesterase family hydrolase
VDVMTVLGPVPARQLGVTLPHEHVFIDLVREYRGDGLLNDHALAVEELAAFAEAGGRTVVDCTSLGLGRDPEALARVARETGLNVVMGCGWYRDPYLPDELDQQPVEALAELVVRDIEEGVAGTGIRAGIIGEVGADRWYVSAREERSFRAAARAHHRTGLTITTHAARWPVGLPQLDLLAEERVDPRRVVVGHCDMVPDPDYHLALARRGAWVQFDTVHGESEYDVRCRVAWIRNLGDHGHLDQVLLSQDVCLRSDLRALGGPGYGYLVTGFAEVLRGAGFSEDDLRMLLVDNPRRALTGEWAAGA